ncbi:macrolide 2'-phosphotransferase [Arthrobacter koreensis]|uniref:macrolide 2'-phosphotransferase n=1 Tax=Arthrobacter koreensis TaxID=199136 RepID=UPI0012645C1A|nr:macrolide 2'-phosphotransferase [Arthrobacter koreensis]
MKRTPMELAALASAAVPALALTGVAGSPDDAPDFDSALLVDDAGKQWRVRSPKHVEASMRLETELLVLRAFVPGVRAELPFALPYVAGTVRQGQLCTFVYSHLPGSTRDIDELAGGGAELAADIGRTMAAIHALPQSLVNNADLPSYTANEFRQRKLNELDQAATTGKIPATLLRRWEHALEDVALWRFSPTVVHGDLHEDNLLVSGGRVSAVNGWTDLRIGDPADDFAWLIAANNSGFTDTVHHAYVEARPDAVDPHLIRRAALSAEFALAQWLVRGIAAENQSMVEEAEEMLATLEADILEQEAAEQEAADAPVVPADSAAPSAAPAASPAPGASPATAATAAVAAPAGNAGPVDQDSGRGGKVSVAPIPEQKAAEAPAQEADTKDASVSAASPGSTEQRGTTDAAAPVPSGSGSAAAEAEPATSALPLLSESAGTGTDAEAGQATADSKDAAKP